MKIGVLATTLAVLMIAGISFSAAAGPAGDSDSDGTYDVLDICSSNPNAPSPNGCDTDADGYGNACDGDLDNNGTVGAADIGVLLGLFAQSGTPGFNSADLDCNGTIGAADLGILLGSFGQPPGPSGLSCAGDVGSCD